MVEYKVITNDLEKSLFVDAWAAAFGYRLDDEVYSWLFHNGLNNMYGIFDKDKVVAGYCLLDQKVVYNGEVVDGALCNNVFVTPDYQGMQLFTKLGHFSLQQAGEQGIKVAIGIPNKNAVAGHKKVGWTFQNEINFLEKNRGEKANTTQNSNMVAITIENYNEYQDRLEQFSLDISRQRSFSVVKDKVFFKWRYLQRPSVDYKIFFLVENEVFKGYVVYKYYDGMKRLHIVDIEAADEEAFNELLNLAEGFEEPFTLVNVWGSSAYYDNFIKADFTISTETNHLIAIKPGVDEPIQLGDKVNIVLGDNEVF